MARYDHRQVQRARFAVESSFGTDMTTDVGANFHDIRHKPTFINRETAMAADETVVQRFFQRHNYVLGPDAGSCALECYFSSTAEALTTGVTPTKRPQSYLLEALMGGYYADEGSAIVASPSPTTTSGTVTTGEGINFEEGQLVGIVVAGVVYPVYITAISTDALTWWPALPAAPATGAVVYNAQNIYFDESADSSLQVLTEAAIDRGNIWLLSGAQGDLSFNLARGGLLTFSTTLRGALYEHDDEIATPQGGSAIALASYTDKRPKWGHAGGIHFGPTNSTTRTLVNATEITVNPGIEWIEIPLHSGTQGIGEWERQRTEPTVEITIKKPASAGTYELYHDAFKSETDYGLLAWWGSVAGDLPAIACPTMQIKQAPEVVEVNGLECIKVVCMIKEADLASDQTTAQRRSPITLGMA